MRNFSLFVEESTYLRLVDEIAKGCDGGNPSPFELLSSATIESCSLSDTLNRDIVRLQWLECDNWTQAGGDVILGVLRKYARKDDVSWAIVFCNGGRDRKFEGSGDELAGRFITFGLVEDAMAWGLC